MDFRVTITQLGDSSTVYIELLNMVTGDIVTTGEAILDKIAIINCIDVMLTEHL